MGPLFLGHPVDTYNLDLWITYIAFIAYFAYVHHLQREAAAGPSFTDAAEKEAAEAANGDADIHDTDDSMKSVQKAEASIEGTKDPLLTLETFPALAAARRRLQGLFLSSALKANTRSIKSQTSHWP